MQRFAPKGLRIAAGWWWAVSCNGQREETTAGVAAEMQDSERGRATLPCVQSRKGVGGARTTPMLAPFPTLPERREAHAILFLAPEGIK